jgi:hypothetical protein
MPSVQATKQAPRPPTIRARSLGAVLSSSRTRRRRMCARLGALSSGATLAPSNCSLLKEANPVLTVPFLVANGRVQVYSKGSDWSVDTS